MVFGGGFSFRSEFTFLPFDGCISWLSRQADRLFFVVFTPRMTDMVGANGFAICHSGLFLMRLGNAISL